MLYVDVHGSQAQNDSGHVVEVLDIALGNSGHSVVDVYSVGVVDGVMHLTAVPNGPPYRLLDDVATFTRPIALAPGARAELAIRLTSDACPEATPGRGALRVEARLGHARRATVALHPEGGAADDLTFSCPTLGE